MTPGLLLLLCCVACGTTDTTDARLLVLAASSLHEAMGDLERGFEESHPGVDVVVSFAGSQALATQIRHGILADVFASADLEHVQALADEGLVGTPRPFATNSLVLAVSSRYDGEVSLARLSSVGSVVVGDEDVPVGRYTAELLETGRVRYGDDWRADVERRIVSREPNVRLASAKVSLGEADVAVVYATDAAVAPGIRAVALPPGMSPTTRSFHAVGAGAAHPELAEAWLAFVESGEGQALLAARGFSPPGA